MKKQTKHQKIIALYKEGMKPKDIAAKLKIKTQTVYAAKHLENKKVKKDGVVSEVIFKGGKITFKPDPKAQIKFESPEAKSFFYRIKKLIFGA